MRPVTFEAVPTKHGVKVEAPGRETNVPGGDVMQVLCPVEG